MAKIKNRPALIALDIEGEWNLPLLENAAGMFETDLIYASSGSCECVSKEVLPIDKVLASFNCVIACETAYNSKNIFEYPMPRGKVAVIVGNEEHGIPKQVLKKAHAVVSIPMKGAGMSSTNVAVAGAVVLYVIANDLARQKRHKSSLSHKNIDILAVAPENPSELGSFLRSAWAFGWKRVFVSDPHGAWFSKDKANMLESRAAARRFKNPMAVLPAEQLAFKDYDHIIHCSENGAGVPLSRLNLPDCRRLLLVVGDTEEKNDEIIPKETVFVNRVKPGVNPCFRHMGSIFLAMVSAQLR
jgi:tRNA G18 (ribose-2'-O)-methylase SpoU